MALLPLLNGQLLKLYLVSTPVLNLSSLRKGVCIPIKDLVDTVKLPGLLFDLVSLLSLPDAFQICLATTPINTRQHGLDGRYRSLNTPGEHQVEEGCCEKEKHLYSISSLGCCGGYAPSGHF